jgi:hypothetical protein
MRLCESATHCIRRIIDMKPHPSVVDHASRTFGNHICSRHSPLLPKIGLPLASEMPNGERICPDEHIV